ncbi:hypothetical protein INT46_005036 [Mucor plumbeus]|uniref:HAT C-terminal dimerisation domain-containing protein n=1 Tax=Mucor plumbeus TaxID=97098 RepID=A0A8H7QHH1_9FUNG|nr:hypothetical protein INT46_005036 [Mucor plumbeus]
MVERFLILKDAYNHVVAGTEELRDACYINQEELQYLEKLNDYLDIFYATTLFLCSQRYTTINKTIQLINVIFDSLENFIADNKHEEDLNIILLVHAPRLGLQKLSLYYQRTDDSPIFSCSKMLDCASKFNYWSDEEWESVVINEQEKACRPEYKSFLYNSFTDQQNLQIITTLESTLPTSTTTASSSTASTATAITVPLSTVATTTTSSTSSAALQVILSSTKKSFGISGKRKLKIKNKKIEDSMKRQRPCNVFIKDLIEAGQRELIEYLASDDTEDFPIQELFFETCVSDDEENEIITPNNIDIIEEGYDGQQSMELSLETSSLWNGMTFARQSLDYWKHYQHKYPNLSRFARKILAIPATCVASERLFSLAKRTVNSNSANLSETNAEYIVWFLAG